MDSRFCALALLLLSGCATAPPTPPQPMVAATLPPDLPDTKDWVWIEMHCSPRFSTVERFHPSNADTMMEFRVDGLPVGVFSFSYEDNTLSNKVFALFGNTWKSEQPQIMRVEDAAGDVESDQYIAVETAPGGVWGESRMVLEATRLKLGLADVAALDSIINTCTTIVERTDF